MRNNQWAILQDNPEIGFIKLDHDVILAFIVATPFHMEKMKIEIDPDTPVGNQMVLLWGEKVDILTSFDPDGLTFDWVREGINWKEMPKYTIQGFLPRELIRTLSEIRGGLEPGAKPLGRYVWSKDAWCQDLLGLTDWIEDCLNPELPAWK